jgi:hypothetical protein
VHVSRIRGEPPVRAFMHLDRAYPLIQASLSGAVPDEALIAAVFYVMLTEAAFGEFQTLHDHLRGIGVMYLRAMKGKTKLESSLMQYVAVCSGYLDTVPGLLGWPLAIPDHLVPHNTRWLRHLMATPDSERWVQLDQTHVIFSRQIARYKYWAASLRKREDHTEQDEQKIVERGKKLLQALQHWQQMDIPPYYEETPSPGAQDDCETINSRRFLGYTRFQFESPLHAEIHLLYYGLILITSFIIDPVPGSFSQERVDTAIKHCQCLAVLGISPSALAPETRAFSQFYVRLTFDDAYPAGQFHAGNFTNH